MRFKDFSRIHISLFAKVSFATFAICILLKLIAMLSTPFADFFNRYVASLLRGALAYATSFLPFSLAEAVILMLLPISVLYLAYCMVSAARRDKLTRHIFNLLGLICILLSAATVQLSMAYDCTPVEERMELETEELTNQDIFDACVILLEELDSFDDGIARSEKGSAVMPYSFAEMSKKINASFAALGKEYDFLPPLSVPPKRIALSKPLTYTGLAGIYTFFTGEANVNTNFPDYAVAFTSAHEMAHQRGIAPEDEANFIAFLVCYTSEDTFLRYSAITEMANYLSNSLYESDMELFEELVPYFSDATVGEYVNHAEGVEPYTNSAAGDIAEAVNDAYLKSQGVAEGVDSYDLVTSLATAYILAQ